MFSKIVITLGYLGFVAGIVFWLVQGGTDADAHAVDTTRQILLGACAVLVGGYVLKYVAQFFGISKGRCQKCGKRIDKGEMFCFDHRREAIWHAQEHDKTFGTRIR